MSSKWHYNNLTFSFIKEEELEPIATILNDKEVEKYLWFAPITLEGLSEFALPVIKKQLQLQSENKYPSSVIFTVKKDTEIIGMCGLFEMQDAHNAVLIGYQLKPSAWGRGYGTNCLRFLIHYSKKYLKLRKLFGDCYSENTASIKIMEKCGFEYEGTLKEKYESNGKLYDNSWFGLKMKKAQQIPDEDIREST